MAPGASTVTGGPKANTPQIAIATGPRWIAMTQR